MQLRHEDKSITNVDMKLSPAAQRAFDLRTADLALTDAERHEVGYRVAQAAEAASRRPYQVELSRLAEPTQAEAAELAAALAEFQALVDATATRRAIAIEAEREVHDLVRERSHGYGDAGDDRRLAVAQAEERAAAANLRIADEAQRPAEGRIGRLRGEMSRAAGARQRAFVGGRI